MDTTDNDEDWEWLADTPEEFAEAIENATTENERIFFTTLRYKVLHEAAGSYDVLMHDEDNEDGIFILRISDDFLIGRKDKNGKEVAVTLEVDGLFFFLEQDMCSYIGQNISVLEWLRGRDYKGIRYDGNNDLR